MTPSSGRSARIPAIHLVDVLVYLVVLGLFAQFLPAVLSETFAVSLATAVLLKFVLEAVVLAKNAVLARLRGTSTTAGRVLGVAALVGVSAGSKFVVLWLTDLVLGDAVHLGGFFSVTLLVVTLIVARALVRRIVDARWSSDDLA